MSPSATARPSLGDPPQLSPDRLLPSKSLPNTTNGTTTPDLDASLLRFTPTTTPRPVPLPNSPEVASQSTCTDHMITSAWTAHAGWSAPHLQPYAPLTLSPTASVLHYSTSCFEGLKAYRGHDGRLRLFRPDRNCARMLASAARVTLPAFDPAELEKLIKALVRVEGPKWVPPARPGAFIYIRPTLIATHPALGMQPPKEALLFIIACFLPSLDDPRALPTPAPTPTPTPTKPPAATGLKLLASPPTATRAWPTGFGASKIGANYGPSLPQHSHAQSRGYDQVLWLFGPDHLVTEAGASNFFVVWRARPERGGRVEMVTAALDMGLILAGVTRGCVLELARARLGGEGVAVVERAFGMREVVEAVEEGRVVEAFAAGTAGRDLDIPVPGAGGYAARIKAWLGDIMFGRVEHEWGVVVDEDIEEEEETGGA
ncbi:hypothetical protein FGG08_001215 [Glutinoglossum americanum]|uniref:Branched-chain-amino-acid aminotransferase n=1 Tax=Glutinoglossum americanum TaxID=1670608 RepID=A0A9P8L5I4_9PEZI|nr:hypothetical protein FGG08_001215 [Glutinoglossum americanum]